MSLSFESITIRGFRGIRDEVTVDLHGQDAIIFGPNGSGKSTVLQAVEFLLTGNISALQGSGTGGIRPTTHVPNRYTDPARTKVSATMSTESGEPFQLTREFTNRNRLKAERRPPELRELLDAASQGLLQLTREQLLELVLATPGTRKDEIYQLLNTSGIDARRRQLKRLTRKAQSKADDRATILEEHKAQLADLGAPGALSTADDQFSLNDAAVKQVVNGYRNRLGGDSLETVSPTTTFREELSSPVEQAAHPLQRTEIRTRLETLRTWFEREATELRTNLESLRSTLRALQADDQLLTSLAERSLVEQGREIVDPDTTACPLCQTSWQSGELEAALSTRAERLKRVEERTQSVRDRSSTIEKTVSAALRPSTQVLETLEEDSAAVETDLAPLVSFCASLENLQDCLDADLAADPSAVDVELLTLGRDQADAAAEVVSELLEAARNLPNLSRLEQEWNDLGGLEDVYRNSQRAIEEYERFQQASTELDVAHDLFIESRDAVLGDILDVVSERFAAFYKAVNPDEDAFDPRIGQSSTGVEFEVGFYDQGAHPPNALHSEGHQDLMGVCLFLALVAEFSPLDTTPVLLDDVVMAVDTDHRQHLASVLAGELGSHFQLVLTTHDPEWVHQLVDAGAVDASNVIRFDEWTPAGSTHARGLPTR